MKRLNLLIQAAGVAPKGNGCPTIPNLVNSTSDPRPPLSSPLKLTTPR